MPLPAPSACAPQAMALAPAAWAATKLILLHGPVIFFAVAAARLFRRGRLPVAVAAMLIYFLAISLPPWVGPVSYPWLQAWSAAYGAAGVAIRIWEARRRDARIASSRRSDPANDLIALGGVLTVALLAAALLATAVFDPRFDYDPLIYQLYFAAAWLRDGHLSIVPIFGDPSQAYGPALASVYYLWLMAPIGTDLLAQTGQWPFLLLTVLAAAGLDRELGARRPWLAGVFIFMAPLTVYEARSAFSDLAVTGFFTASLYFLVRAIRARRPADLALGLVAAGLMAGSKLTAIPLLVLILPLLALVGVCLRDRGAGTAWFAGAAGGMAGGGIWYARNWIISGNPIFPIRVSILSHEIFPGLYGRAQMMNWWYHLTSPLAWWSDVCSNVSPLMLAGGVAALFYLSVRGVVAMRKKTGDADGEPASRPLAAAMIYLALLPLLIDRVCWDVIPYQQSRFWIPAIPVLAAAFTLLCSSSRPAAAAALAVSYAGLLLFPNPDFMGRRTFFWIETALPACAAVGFGIAWLLRRHFSTGVKPNPAAPSLATTRLPSYLIAAFALFILTAAGLPSYQSRRTAALLDMRYGPGWLALPCSSSGLTVAYTGPSLAYPLLGPRLQNHVEYVSPSGRVMPHDHEIFREMHGQVPAFQTPEPMLSSIKMDPRQWANSLVSSGADYLFVVRLIRNSLLNNAHDPQGWPLEDSWARAAPGTFIPFYQDKSVRIYRLDPAVPPELPEEIIERPADGIIACAYGPNPDCQKFFPLAPLALRTINFFK